MGDLGLLYNRVGPKVDPFLYHRPNLCFFYIRPYINDWGIINSLSVDLYPIHICVLRLQVKASLCRQCCGSCGDAGPVLIQHWVNFPCQRVF